MTFGLSYQEVRKIEGLRNHDFTVSISNNNMHTVSAR